MIKGKNHLPRLLRNRTKPDAPNRTLARPITPPPIYLTDRHHNRGSRGGIKRPPPSPHPRIQEETQETSAAAGSGKKKERERERGLPDRLGARIGDTGRWVGGGKRLPSPSNSGAGRIEEERGAEWRKKGGRRRRGKKGKL